MENALGIVPDIAIGVATCYCDMQWNLQRTVPIRWSILKDPCVGSSNVLSPATR